MDHQEKAEQQDVREEIEKQSKLIDNNFKIIVCLIFASILIPCAIVVKLLAYFGAELWPMVCAYWVYYCFFQYHR